VDFTLEVKYKLNHTASSLSGVFVSTYCKNSRRIPAEIIRYGRILYIVVFLVGIVLFEAQAQTVGKNVIISHMY
jgi:hypothetical protein